ncbi:Kinesin [Macleaya cordata]|uniref:Kinesin n=1 Tax=Macleaya cordata TaxID=56857 RepID=A0A200QRT5_MACCD|nr:Kinesin [Macleaya cordata]
MASRNQNKPPTNTNSTPLPPRSPSNKKDNFDEIPLDKRRKIGSAKMVGQANSGRTRQAFSVVNVAQDLSMRSDSAGNGGSECGSVEFTKEDVEALVNEKMKGKNKFDYKGKCEQMTDYIKKLRLCIKWFQEIEASYVLEREKLQSTLDSLEKKCDETEVQMRNKVDDLETLIAGLRENAANLEEELAKVNSEKMAAIDSHNSEKEARVAIERMRASLAEELEKSQEELASANQKIESLTATYRNSQEYNTSLQQYNSRLQKDCETYKTNLAHAEQERAVIVERLSTFRGRITVLQDELASFRTSRDETLKQKEALASEVGVLRADLQQVRDDRDRQLLQVQNLTAEVVKYKECTGKSSAELDNLTLKSKVLEDTCSTQKEQIQLLQHQLAAANEKLQMADLTTLETRSEFEAQKKLVQDLQNRLADADFQIIEAEKLRKKLHNTILELKGNIRVFCRVRPLLPDDGATDTTVISYPTSTESQGRGIDLLQSGQKHPFTFDKVFSHESSQQDVFVEISQLVQSALDGYKVCIFAYGQTGSGKTYTMMGRPETPEQKGLIPRSLEQIFQSSQYLVSQGWKYKMQASMLEIYNETIRDLLCTNRAGCPDSSATGKQYTIKHDANGNTHVSDLTIVDVCSFKEVSSLLHQAAQSRSVSKTLMNEQSSRSHFVFTLRISGVNESTEQQVQGILNLIDLAGSERLSKSGSTGDRLRETQAINKSLSSLSDVIFALAKKEDHVPFRNSKLTYLLQPCLGGDSKTLMFVNISPDPSSVGESLCSLRFAARVNACEIGIPRRQTNMRTTDSRLSYG